MSESKNTKQALASALKTLMAAHPFEKISVGDICSECGMSRKSFYYHFQDKYDLMNWIFYTEFISTLQLPALANNEQLLAACCSFFHRERLFYRNALSVRGQNCFQDYFIEVVRPFMYVFMQDRFPEETTALPFYAAFYTDALLAALIRWMNDDAPTPPEHFAHLLIGAIMGGENVKPV